MGAKGGAGGPSEGAGRRRGRRAGTRSLRSSLGKDEGFLPLPRTLEGNGPGESSSEGFPKGGASGASRATFPWTRSAPSRPPRPCLRTAAPAARRGVAGWGLGRSWGPAGVRVRPGRVMVGTTVLTGTDERCPALASPSRRRGPPGVGQAAWEPPAREREAPREPRRWPGGKRPPRSLRRGLRGGERTARGWRAR